MTAGPEFFAAPLLRSTRRPDGALVLESLTPLPAPVRNVVAWLARWAREAPERIFLREPTEEGWRALTYGAAFDEVQRLGEGLLRLGVGRTRPLMLLSDNSTEHALLQLAAMSIGAPAAPVSPSYTLQSSDRLRLLALGKVLAPAVLFADDAQAYREGLDALAPLGAAVVTARGGRPGALPYAALRAQPAGEAWARAFEATGPEDAAKVLFTSGSTGAPKGVVNTHRMLTSNQDALAAGWPFLDARPPVLVDWLPWSHTFGGNHDFNLALRNGGTLVIDHGKPIPGRMELSIAALREVAPTLYFNVPRGFAMLLPFLEGDAAFAAHFFSRLELLFFAAAALPADLYARLRAVADAAGKPGVPIASAWGSTETSPLVTQVHMPNDSPRNIGVPIAGTALALVPVEGKLELRVKGPQVARHSWGQGGALVPIARDAHDFLPMGDAGELLDAAHPERGLLFAGRLAENFKLSSGTWVHVGELRLKLLEALGALALDVIVAGHDRDAVGALLIPKPGVEVASALPELERRLRAFAAQHPQQSKSVRRAAFTLSPLSIDGGEITDKGYVNQRACLLRRADEVEALFAVTPDSERVVAL